MPRACRMAPRYSNHEQPARPRKRAVRLNAADISEEDTTEVLDEADQEFCYAAMIYADNNDNETATLLSLEAKEYPGLLRVISWVLNGLDCKVQNARLKTDAEGYASHRYWLTDRRGRKLKDSAAEMLVERLRDFVQVCKPPGDLVNCQDFKKDNITISNTTDNQYTVVSIDGEPDGNRPGFLLELASVVTGVGLTIHEAVIENSPGASKGGPAAQREIDYPSTKGRQFTFWVTDQDSRKLDVSRALALIYTLGLVFGNNNGPLVAPNLELAQAECEV